MTETYVTGYLDRMGALDKARGAGCYAVRLCDPGDDATAIGNEWMDHYNAHPPAGFCERAAFAEKLCYVGSHGKSVYERLCQHARGHKSSTIMALWPPVDIEAIWPSDSPRDLEWGHANELADEQTAVWSDGNYL